MGILVVRLRVKDAEIESALNELSKKYDKSDIVREALRQYLFKKDNYNKYNKTNIDYEINETEVITSPLNKIEASNEIIDELLDEVMDSF